MLLPRITLGSALQPFPQFEPPSGPWWVVLLVWLAYVVSNGRLLVAIILAVGWAAGLFRY